MRLIDADALLNNNNTISVYDDEFETWVEAIPIEEVEKAPMVDNPAPNERDIPQKPVPESMADYLCPKCGNYLNFDALNDSLQYAPNFCSTCGQALTWEGARIRGRKPCPCCGKIEFVYYLAGELHCAACGGDVH